MLAQLDGKLRELAEGFRKPRTSLMQIFVSGTWRPEKAAQYRTQGEELGCLIARGGFGSPTMFVNGDDMYFGNDRLELVRAAAQRAKITGNPHAAGRGQT